NLGGFGGDFDRFLRSADLQGGVESHHLIDVDGHAFLHVLLKPGQLVVERVGAGNDLDKSVVAAFAGQRVAADAGRLVEQSNLHGREDGAAGIGDSTHDAAAGTLSREQ